MAANLRELRKLHDKYALELGRMVAEWNNLHDSLAYLFWQATGISDSTLSFAIWHSTPSDLSQRKMLRAVAMEKYAKDIEYRKDILWLIDKIDHQLASKRNDANHAPVVFRHSSSGLSIAPLSGLGNPRADGLDGKEIVKEIIWYRKMASVLNEYAYDLYEALDRGKGRPLPPRPSIPTLNSRLQAKGKTPAGPRKAPSPPPQS